VLENVFSNNSRYLAAVKFASKVRSETETNVQSNLAKACIAAQHELINGTNVHPTWLLAPTQACPPNGISVGSSVFAGLAVVSNTQTHAQSTLRLNVRSNRPQLVLFTVLAMRLNVDECRHEGVVLDNEDNLRTNGQNS